MAERKLKTLELLDQLNVDLAVEAQKLHDLHYFVYGDEFFTIHKKLEEFYEALQDQNDLVAEEILKLGGKPTATMAGFLKKAKIVEMPDRTFFPQEDVKKTVIKDFDFLIGEIHRVHEVSDQEEVYTTSNMLDDIISWYARSNWMTKQDQKDFKAF